MATKDPTTAQPTPGSSWTIDDDETPWTEGDSQAAAEHGEPFGQTEIMFDIRDADGVVARIPWEPIAGDGDQERIRANARLIAAAPEMLHVLRGVMVAYRDETLRGLSVDEINAARALLARIEG